MVYSLIIVRWVHWTACLLLGASQVYCLWGLPKGAPTEQSRIQPWAGEFRSRLDALAGAAWALALLSLVLWFGLTAWNMTGSDAGIDLSLLSAVATQTQFGRVSLARLAVLAVGGVCLFTARGEPVATADHAGTAAGMALALANLLALGLTSHAAAAPGPAGVFRFVVDAVHLGAASIWPGGLVCFALFLHCALRSRPSPLVTVAAGATHRFSTCSLLAVAVLSGTGLTMSFFFLHHVHDLWTSGYGRLLTAKLLVFSGMLAIGGWNLLVLRRKLGRQAQRDRNAEAGSTACTLFRNVVCEIVLGVIVLLIVAALGLTGPPAHSEATGYIPPKCAPLICRK
jgi:copper resistance protein D